MVECSEILSLLVKNTLRWRNVEKIEINAANGVSINDR